MCAALYLPPSGGGGGAAFEDALGPAALRRPMLRQRYMYMYAYMNICELRRPVFEAWVEEGGRV
jgi:hypothetical protein